MGQGVVETDNGAGSVFNARKFSLLPREIPELVRRLINSAQSQTQQQQLLSNPLSFMGSALPSASGLIKKERITTRQ